MSRDICTPEATGTNFAYDLLREHKSSEDTARQLILASSNCSDPNQARAEATLQMANLHFQTGNMRSSYPICAPGLDEIVTVAQKELTPNDFVDYQKKLLSNPQFKQLEPAMALEFLTKHFDDIHHRSNGKALTEDELKTYLKDCSPSPAIAELVNWALREKTGGAGTDASRFAFLKKEAGDSTGLTLEDLSSITGRFNCLSATRKAHPTLNLDDLQSLESKFIPPYTTQAHPDGLTEFSLDRIANDASLSIWSRQSAQSLERDFDKLKKFTGASGDQIKPDDIKVGEGKVRQELAAWEAQESSYKQELRNFYD